MSAPDVHTLTGAYAADALPEPERRAFEEHLQECPDCAQEVAELTATAARLGAAATIPAPPGLRERVLAEAQQVRQLSPLAVAAGPPAAAGRRPWFRHPMGIAAAFLLVVSLGLGAIAVTAARRADRMEERAHRVAAMATDPDRVVVTRPGRSGGTGTVVMAAGDALFTARGLPALPAARTYQLWVIGRDGPRSVGVLGRGTGEPLEQLVADVRPGESLGLTVEPRGGSDTPTTPPVVLLPMAT